ncbi:MAG TPA: ABC transporter substrate-binding protein [Thermoanaerobaculia bacterium]|nr:ABC transporter substrate-binding protein [Thermoanaerobaculia bacterium]
MNARTQHRIFRSPSILALALLAACGGSEPDTVGVVLPLSGADKVYGRSLERGITLAYEDLQRRAGEDGVPFRIEVRDSASHPQRAAEQADALYDAGAQAVVGGATDAEARAMVPVADRKERVLLSPSASSASLAGQSRHVFRLSPSDYQQAVKMGGFAVLELDLARTAVLMPDTDPGMELGQVFREEFERQGGRVLSAVGYPEDVDPDRLVRFVGRALDQRPQGVYLATAAGDRTAPAVLAELARQGFRGTVMTTSAFASSGVIAEAGRGAEGLVVSASSFDPASEDPKVRGFVEAYRERFDADPDAYAAHGYDALMALAEAMGLEESAGGPRRLWQGLRALSGFQGVTGYIQFDEQGNVGQFPRVFVVDHGELTELEGEGARRRLAALGRTTGEIHG